MTKQTKSFDAEGTDTSPPNIDVSPEAIAALVAEGASALGDVPVHADASPDALPLLVGITHDLRSPLSSMLVLIERMRAGHAGPLTPLQEKQLGLLYSATFGVVSLTNDALDVARGAARDYGSVPTTVFSVTEVWRAVRGLVQPIAEEKRLMLRFSGPAHDRRIGHPAVLHRVLLNLVTNALKFTASGSVTVTAEELDDRSVRFLVTDTGDGLPLGLSNQLRASSEPTAATVASSGLGLAMCQQMLHAVGSRLDDFSSPERTGASLGFVVPCTRA